MYDDLGLQYMKEHFEPYTGLPVEVQIGDVKIKIEKGEEDTIGLLAPRCLSVDSHSSHVTWRIVQYALDHKIHMICLPS